MGTGNDFRSVWQPFLTEYQERRTQLLRANEDAIGSIKERLEQVKEALLATDEQKLEPDRLAALGACFGESSRPLLVEPLTAHMRAAPQKGTLRAITEFRTSMGDVARRLPAFIWVSGRELSEVVGPLTRRSPDRVWLRFQKKFRPFHLRAIVQRHLQHEELRRAHLDGEFQLLLARANLHIAGPWHLVRQRSLDFFEDGAAAPGRMSRPRELWLRRRDKLLSTATKLGERYDRWQQGASARLSAAMLARLPKPRRERSERNEELLTEYFAYWSRQQRAVEDVLNLELMLARLVVRVTEIGERVLQSLDTEHQTLLEELDAVIRWLRSCQETGKAGEWPPQKAELVAADARITQLNKEISDIARDELPAHVETINPKRPLPGWREPWRPLEPEAIFLRVQQEGSRDQATMDALCEAEEAHRAIVRQVDRAREVVAFGAETAREEGGEGIQIAAEGIANAIGLLEYHQQNAQPVRPVAERGLTRGIATGFLESYIALDQGRLGLLTHLLQESSERGAKKMWQIGLEHARLGALGGWRWLRKSWNKLLVVLGLKTPPSPPTEAVRRAERLDEILELRLVRPDLPLIYRRLFRLDPVSDPRYLVGRDEEMTGLVEARVQWLTGKAASVLLVGARGSGKTSLLNCTAKIAFDGLPQTRAQFSERLLDAPSMDRFLREQLALPEGGDICEALRTERRVVMIEEVERTFLRRMNGFEAVGHLLDIIAATWHDVLWVLSLNETAHRYLNLTLGIDRFFTHRVNAMAVKIEDVRDAIMLRHNLSGFRLIFPPPPERDPRVSHMRQRLGLERDAADVFFETLYEQSEGIFRASFELWQHHIERVEGGAVHLRRPVAPSFEGLLSALTVNDCFTLQAVLQHGGLKAEELAVIFSEAAEAGHARIERLLALEILESDPAGPGLRVRPEAGRLVREALHRQNL